MPFLGDIRTSLSVLTIIPARADLDRRGAVLSYAPVVGALLGTGVAALVALGHALLQGPIGALLNAVLVLAALAVVTRGMHLDGLADTADGFGPLAGRDRALEVMRLSDIGPFGVATICFVLLIDTAALAEAISLGRGPVSIAIAVFGGRTAMLMAGRPSVSAARADGLGAWVAGSVPQPVAWGFPALAVAVTFLAGLAGGSSAQAARASLALVAGLIAGLVVTRSAVRRLGGITGDVLGAICEITTAVVLLVSAFS